MPERRVVASPSPAESSSQIYVPPPLTDRTALGTHHYPAIMKTTTLLLLPVSESGPN